MINNERGGSLVYVLLLILVFSVLGMALMGNAVSETKRTKMTESEIQAQNLALNGLTFFETAFKIYVGNAKTTSSGIDIGNFVKSNFVKEDGAWVPIGPKSNPGEMQIKAELHLKDEKNIIVWSKGTVGDVEKVFKGHYKLDYEMDEEGQEPGNPIYDIPNFSDAMALDFNQSGVVGLQLGNLLNLDLIKGTGNDKKFYPVPYDDALDNALELDVNVAEELLGVSWRNRNGNGFKVFEEIPIIAIRNGTVLGVDILKGKKNDILSFNVLKLKENDNTNVLINGHYVEGIEVTILGIPLVQQVDRYKDIDFQKLAVIGNCLIQQNPDSTPRRFTFKEGLYVNKSLVIGENKDSKRSHLRLRGDMIIMEDLSINAVDLGIGDSDENESNLAEEDYFTSMYVQGNAKIKNACISTKANHHVGLFIKGTLTIENKPGCTTYPGLYYAEGGIDIKTNGVPMTIKGGLIGDVTVDHPDKLVITEKHELLPKVKITDVNLLPQGRAIEYNREG